MNIFKNKSTEIVVDNTEINTLSKRILEDNAEWVRRFDGFLDDLIYEDPYKPTGLLIEKAAELADFRKTFLVERGMDIK